MKYQSYRCKRIIYFIAIIITLLVKPLFSVSRKFNAILNQFVSVTGCIVTVLISTLSANGQSNISGYNDVAKQRLLIRITSHYIHTISQGQIDMDSAVRIPCKLYELSPLLAYNEGYSDGKPSPGTILLDNGKVEEARALLTNMHGETRLRLLIELASYFIFKPGTERKDLDEASMYIKQSLVLSENRSDQWKIESLTVQAFLLSQLKLTDESQKIFAEIVTLSEQTKNRRAQAQALLSAGRLYNYGHPSRLSNFEKALAIFRSLHATEKEIETLSEINVEKFVFKHYDAVEQITRKIIALETQINFHHKQYAYDVMSFLAKMKGDITSAISYSNKSLESMHSGADSVFSCLFYIRRGDLFSDLKKYDEALECFDKALQNKTNDTRLYWYKAFLIKAGLLNYLNREAEALALLTQTGRQFAPVTTFDKMYFAITIGQAYEQLKKLDIAENQYNAFLKLAENFPDEYIQVEFPRALSQISGFYRTIGKTDKARQLLNRGKPYSFQMGTLGKSLYYYDLFKIDSAEKKYLAAIKDLQLGNLFMDSTFSAEQRKKADELLVKYEADKKDKDIKLLNSQNQLQRISVNQANKTKNITLSFVALLLIIVGLLFNRYIIKQRSNHKLELNQKELDKKNSSLEALNADQHKLIQEKEWLIKEIHHRVKNNLEIIMSLLNSQSKYIDNDAALMAINDSQRRVQAISLIHQKLYQSENTSSIAMRQYIDELVNYLDDSFDTVGRSIIIEQDIEPLKLDVAKAIPVGLIINESIVNAIKYAFPNGNRGIVRITLKSDGLDDHIVLTISDNGIGLPPNMEVSKHDSLGFSLMSGLARQLDGNFNMESYNGLHISIRFSASNNQLYD